MSQDPPQDSPSTELIEHRGGCHCGQVRYRVHAPSRIRVSQCNCSICSRSGYLGLIVPGARFELLSGEEYLENYLFNSGTAQHRFCRTCGIKSFYIPRSHPDGVNVNARCLDPGTVLKMTIESVDGQNWEDVYADGRNNPYPAGGESSG